ncbi:pyridoxamine 5'-phosphate oxidase [Barrientosiimonas humi]|uniref:Pyridoxamine 5'-phosphate oxidase n=1 Tax=Barrientosiimonas humi TaxID=999931 RepID=A0A542XEU0_9MICO|nr:pyridoxamine 5'-phosphate oxidase [Barrientosiimonas humi]TQL34341.1 pyridoxamine 5'-phosphate oxidase [Barrientosiimonas humi]CAG7574333.1 Pyridoxine/pyridoxamine 5'-phosphate oxidase [Barrientosiimonas humi]
MNEVLRTDYDGHGLEDGVMPPAPWPFVEEWVTEARDAARERADVPEPDALSVATADASGRPRVRTVLLRHLGPDGFGFFTNLSSRKGRDLAENAAVAASLTWPAMFRAIRVFGRAEQLPRETVEAYFRSRPWGSRISAWTSAQSQPVEDRAALEQAYAAYAEKWSDHGSPDDVPVPDFWGGYLIHCDEVELWGGRRSRLHDRFRYVRVGDGDLADPTSWELSRLQP